MDGITSRGLREAPSHGLSGQPPSTPRTPQQPPPATPPGEPSRPLSGQRQIRKGHWLPPTGQFADMPAEVLQQIAGKLPPRAISSMAQANRATHEALQLLRITAGAQQVATPEHLQRSLAQINGLPSNNQAEPLRQLMLRIHALPRQARQQALTDCRAAIQRRPIEERPAEPPRLQELLRYRSAAVAVQTGEHVGHVAACFDITAPEGIRQLEDASINGRNPNSAGMRIRRYENIQVVARELGITTTEGIRRLEDIAFDGGSNDRAPSRVAGGENVQVVAREFGITTPEGVRRLEGRSMDSFHPNSAKQLVGRGGNVQNVARALGISAPESILRLETIAIDSLHRNSLCYRLHGGENAHAVAHEFGITTPEGIARLESMQADVARGIDITLPGDMSQPETLWRFYC